MECLEVKEIVERIEATRDLFMVGLNTLLMEMETKIIIGEINRPAGEVKKIRKKRTSKVKGELIPGPETLKIEDKPRRERIRRLVKAPTLDSTSVSSKGGVSKPFYLDKLPKEE